jgi:hypothetical protein
LTNLSKTKIFPYIIYIGNGERGLYWYTDSYQGFYLDRYKPYVFVEKDKGITYLKIYFINKPVVLDKVRKIRFALLPVPTKPLPKDFREMAWDSERMHLGGYSWWGTIGCFVFPLNDQEWQNWIKGQPFIYKNKKVYGSWPLITAKKKEDGSIILEKGKEYGAYRAADLIGYLQPEFEVFSGEWIDITNPPLQPDSHLLNWKNPDGTPMWEYPEQRSVYQKDACVESFYDFEAYYFYLMAKNTGAGGYWHDWHSFVEGHSIDKGTMYINDEGKLEPYTNLFLVRSFFERLAKINYLLGIPDTNNVYAPGPVYQMPWLTRINAWESLYLESSLDDMFDAHGIDKYKMIIGKYSGIPVQIVMNIPINMKEKRARTVIGLSLLFDNGIFSPDKNLIEILKKVNFFSSDNEWIPYWRSSKIVVPNNKNLLISVYRKIDGNEINLLLVCVNPTENTIKTDISVIGKNKVINICDLENEANILYESKKGNINLRGIEIKKHDFKLINLRLSKGRNL